ncbi:hypothetical protein FB107DRAFT_289437 [Schizophyllum commune]
MSTFINTVSTPVASTQEGYPFQYQFSIWAHHLNTAGPNTADDHERWYAESWPNNRMVLAVRSGIDDEIQWALERCCRLSHSESFKLSIIPGLLEAFMEWPQWYAAECARQQAHGSSIFSLPPDLATKRRHAIESLFALRNAAYTEGAPAQLISNPATLPLILDILTYCDPTHDENVEFISYAIDIFHVVAPDYVLPPNPWSPPSPLPALMRIFEKTSIRSLHITAFRMLNAIFTNPRNVQYIPIESEALATAIRYAPLFRMDSELVDAGLNYLFAYLSQPTMSKRFLLHPSLPSLLRVLVNILLVQQARDTVSDEISGPVHVIPSTHSLNSEYEPTTTEMQSLLALPEPERNKKWMSIMFVPRPGGEITQVDFYNLYKIAFAPYAAQTPLLDPGYVIKNVHEVFPAASAQVAGAEGAQRYIIAGIARRTSFEAADRFRCKWNRLQCDAPFFSGPAPLTEHAMEHLKPGEGEDENVELPCLWAKCTAGPFPRARLRAHLLTHIPTSQRPARDPSQSDDITLSSATAQYPMVNPTQRPPPPPRRTVVTYTVPVGEPNTLSLTALLCIRCLYRASTETSEGAPHADDDHFGFPGVVEEDDEDIAQVSELGLEKEKQAEARGRRAFAAVKHLMENVQIKDDALQGWIMEMAYSE